MPTHLYSSIVGRFRWFATRFGVSEMFFKPLRLVFSPIVIPLLQKKTFEFEGRTHLCLYARYNVTWAGERMVEIPLIWSFIEQYNPNRILEVGNVLSHYYKINHKVVDKFEKGNGVINVDVLDFRPGTEFDLIVSISTFEHIGFDDDTPGSSREKILAAVEHCRRMLSPSGKMLLTFPTGYNPDLDALILEGALAPSGLRSLIRVGKRDWRQAEPDEAFKYPYRHKYPYANAVLIVEFSSLTE